MAPLIPRRRKTSCHLQQPPNAFLVLIPNLTLQPLPHVLRQRALVRHTWPIPRYSSKMLRPAWQREGPDVLSSWWVLQTRTMQSGLQEACLHSRVNFLSLQFGTKCSLRYRACVFPQKITEHREKSTLKLENGTQETTCLSIWHEQASQHVCPVTRNTVQTRLLLTEMIIIII